MKRHDYIDKLTEIILAAMLSSEDMCREAIIDGRIGLDEMNDGELVEFGKDCWDMVGEVDDRVVSVKAETK